MDRVGDALVWPFRDPEWLEKLVIIGLISLIPLVGGINANGWMMAAVRRLRDGDERLPPAGFGYLWPGFQLFVVLVVYALGLLVLAAVPFLPGVLLLSSQSSSSTNWLLVVSGVALLLLGFGIMLIGSLAFFFITPAIVLATLDGGVGGGLAIAGIWRRIRDTPAYTLLAGLMLVAANFIGGLGIYALVVGIIFTFPYSLAMEAWIVRSYELGAASSPQEALHVGPSSAATER